MAAQMLRFCETATSHCALAMRNFTHFFARFLWRIASTTTSISSKERPGIPYPLPQRKRNRAAVTASGWLQQRCDKSTPSGVEAGRQSRIRRRLPVLRELEAAAGRNTWRFQYINFYLMGEHRE